MYVRKVHMYVASAFSVNGTFQIMGPSKGGTQGVPISVARLYLVAIKYYGTVFLKVIIMIKLIDLPDNFDGY